MSVIDAKKRRLTRGDILTPEEYAKERGEHRRRISELKRRRRVEVGPFATFYFENFATMWHQVHEMLHIERGGEAQIAGEIEDAARRGRVLATLGGIEDHSFIEVPMAQGRGRIRGEPDPTRENTSPEGKASSVQFIRFRFAPDEIASFRQPGAKIHVGFDHANYAHQATLPDPVRAALAEDFD